MTMRSLSPLRLLGACALVLGALAPAGCEDKTPSAVVLVIQSDLVPIEEFKTLEIEISRAGSNAHFATYDIGDQIKTFPATITLQDDPDKETPGDVRAEVKLKALTSLPSVKGGTGSTIERSVQVTFAKEQTKALFVNLDPGCVGFNITSCGQQNVTCGNFGCVSDIYDGASLPNYAESLVVPSPGACFDHTPSGCFQNAIVFPAKQQGLGGVLKKEEGACQVAFPDNIPQEALNNLATNLNVAVVWASTSARYTLLNREDFGAVREGWALKTSSGKPEVSLSEGLCNAINSGEITHIVTSVTCASKRAEQPTCKNPTIDSAWSGFATAGSPTVDCSATKFSAPLLTCETCVKNKLADTFSACLNTPGCMGAVNCAVNCPAGQVACTQACFSACGDQAQSAAQLLTQQAATECPNVCGKGG